MGTLIRFKAYSVIQGYWSLWGTACEGSLGSPELATFDFAVPKHARKAYIQPFPQPQSLCMTLHFYGIIMGSLSRGGFKGG